MWPAQYTLVKEGHHSYEGEKLITVQVKSSDPVPPKR